MIFLDKKEMEASFEKLSDHRLASNLFFPEGEKSKKIFFFHHMLVSNDDSQMVFTADRGFQNPDQNQD